MWSNIVLWTVGLLEFVICCYVCLYVLLYVVPWGDMRAKREISRGIALRLPALWARTRHATRLAVDAPQFRNPVHLRDVCRRMTEDAVRLTASCIRMVKAVARERQKWPREVLQIEQDVNHTLDVIEQMCAMRNEELPALVRVYVEMALERIASVDSLRNRIWSRATELSSGGASYAYEIRCLHILGTALKAHRILAESDPSRVIEVSARWFSRLALIAESVELRGVTQQRILEVRADFMDRAECIRRQLLAARLHLPMLRESSAHKSIAFRLVSLDSADECIACLAQELLQAEVICHTDGTDVGTAGESGRKLADALRSVERVNVRLASFEEDLAFIAATVAEVSAENSKNVN